MGHVALLISATVQAGPFILERGDLLATSEGWITGRLRAALPVTAETGADGTRGGQLVRFRMPQDDTPHTPTTPTLRHTTTISTPPPTLEPGPTYGYTAKHSPPNHSSPSVETLQRNQSDLLRFHSHNMAISTGHVECAFAMFLF